MGAGEGARAALDHVAGPTSTSSSPPDTSTITLNSPPVLDPAAARMPTPLPVPVPAPPRSLPTSPGAHTPLQTPTHATHAAAAAAASPSSVRSSPGPTQRGPALLIPTDRPLDELEETWLPRLGRGRLRVAAEIRLQGYALYGIRSWDLSRTHWALTIATYTGKVSELISCYVLTAPPDMPEDKAQAEVGAAVKALTAEVKGLVRQTEHGTIIVASPIVYGQEVSPILVGDLREAWPYLVLNTGLRRLGCGGRAAMGMDLPVPPVQRKFYESYRVPFSADPTLAAGGTGRTGSPPPATSPTQATMSINGNGHTHGNGNGHGHASASSPPPGRTPLTVSTKGHGHGHSHSHSQSMSSPGSALSPGNHSSQTVLSSAIMLNVVDLVKLIQGALALWGLYGAQHEDGPELDGLFCDETKAAIFEWRRVMGMDESGGALALENETSGGCIDAKTLSTLLSSVTSVRYQLATMGVDKLPRDPFKSTRRFLAVLRSTLQQYHQNVPPYLSVSTIRKVGECYVDARKTHATDALKVHKFLLSGVASATSTLSAGLKGGNNDDSTPLRKREQHLRFRGEGDAECGLGLIVPDNQVGPAAAPDVITSDLDAYTKGILKTREKDWDTMGARRIAELWSGALVHEAGEVGRHHSRLRGAFTRRGWSARDESEEDAPGAIGATFKGMTTRTGAALKGGFGLVNRLQHETSDSDGGGGNKTSKRSNVPTVVEPDEHTMSRSPSPSVPLGLGRDRSHLDLPHSPSPSQSRHSASTGAGLRQSTSPLSDLSEGDGSRPSTSKAVHDAGDSSRWRPPSTIERSHSAIPLSPLGRAGSAETGRTGATGRQPNWASVWRPFAMERTASDGADVTLDENGHEWDVTNPSGTGKRQFLDGHIEDAGGIVIPNRKKLLRRSSLKEPKSEYAEMRIKAADHLLIDVEMCAVVWELRKREKKLAQRVEDMKGLEKSSFLGTQTFFDGIKTRRERLDALENEARTLRNELSRATNEDIDEDQDLERESERIVFKLSEDTNSNEVAWGLRELERTYEQMGGGQRKWEAERRKVEGTGAEVKRSWWRLW
ncbi:hypothetical protein Q8F55_006680 [Vanrija albida]|uniref:STB6-like N-terminal domain-containing protein n=1 Tax=Vanrija albida TaxID=181172 RepID=A0ABR3PXU3_9TREE